MSDFVTALGLLLVLEGVFLALFPHRLRQLLAAMDEMPPEWLRLGGLVAAGIGTIVVWLVRR